MSILIIITRFYTCEIKYKNEWHNLQEKQMTNHDKQTIKKMKTNKIDSQIQ